MGRRSARQQTGRLRKDWRVGVPTGCYPLPVYVLYVTRFDEDGRGDDSFQKVIPLVAGCTAQHCQKG